MAEGRKERTTEIAAGRPSSLTRRGADALVRVERLMEDATRALTAGGAPGKAAGAQGAATARQDAFASASEQQPEVPAPGN